MTIAKMIDHTLLKADATAEDIKILCEEAKAYQFFSVCVNPTWVSLAVEELAGTDVKVCTVVGFPLGATTVETKSNETKDAIASGAQEIDMVINIGALKSGDTQLVTRDIQAVVSEAQKSKSLVKVIIETSLLTDDEKKLACELAKDAGAHFVKTSTGFSSGGATVEDIQIMRSIVGEQLGVKASGGIRDQKFAKNLIQAGATRIGASASIDLLKGM